MAHACVCPSVDCDVLRSSNVGVMVALKMPFAAGMGGGGPELVAIEGQIVNVRITGILANVNP